MKSKQIVRRNDSKTLSPSKNLILSRTDKIPLDLPGICIGHKWERRTLYKYLAHTIARLADGIRLKVIPHVTDAYHLANLYDAVDFARTYEASLDDSNGHKSRDSWSLVSYGSFDWEDVGMLMVWAVFGNDTLLIKHLHTKGRDGVVDLLLSEALVIAESIATAEGCETEISLGSTHTKAAELAWTARIDHIRCVAPADVEVERLSRCEPRTPALVRKIDLLHEGRGATA